MQSDKSPVCENCFRIACKKCDWVASEEEVLQIQKGLLIACPVCGWKPRDNLIVLETED